MVRLLTRLTLVLLIIGVTNGQLSPNFYDSTCPYLDMIVRTVVDPILVINPRFGAHLLNIHFRDCFVNGCDASILLDDTENFTGEKSTANVFIHSLEGFHVIDSIKLLADKTCGRGIVSCADILALAAQYSVLALDGPSWTVALGRRDSTTASLADANNQIPGPELDLNALISSFSNKGFTANELVALSGAHTIGKARCRHFRNRLYNESNIEPVYATNMKRRCTRQWDHVESPLDITTPTTFNNDYFRNLVKQKGLLHSDQQLFSGGATDAQVLIYSKNSTAFFNDFASAMIKLSNLSPLTGVNGEIRTDCRKTN